MTAHRSPTRRAAAAAASVAAAATAALLLSACGNDAGSSAGHSGHGTSTSPSASSPASAGAHNAADVSFAKSMIPHHRQAVQMAGLAETRAASAQVKKLAREIKKAQAPEIRTLSGWLKAWGEQVPEDVPGKDHSGHEMPGMMSAKDLAELKKASGAAFDTAFLDLMVEHHEGAVEMARTERSRGDHQPAKDMAQAIITSQATEIGRMNKLLGR